MEILKQINKELQDYQFKQLQIVPNLFFNQKQTIETIFFYHNSQFKTGDYDDEGDRKYFFNIVRNPCKVFSKAIDFDTKNIRLLTAGGGDPLKTWFMERDLKYWMRNKQFGKILNRIFRELPIYGSVVLKIVEGTPYFVDLRNFAVEQGADTLMDSNYIIEMHPYTPAEFRNLGNKMKWNNMDKVIEDFHRMKDTPHIRVFERIGEFKNAAGKYSLKKVYWADVGSDLYDQNTGQLIAKYPGYELDSIDWTPEETKKQYWEFHKDKIPGRWLGVGVVEELFEPQIKQNETANLESKSAYWNALKIWQTRDLAFNRNLKTDVSNGQVLNAEAEINPINVQEQNGAFFNEQTQKWLRNRDELTFSYDAIQGERSPAGTPLGSTQISITQTLSYFEGIQEEIALDIKEMLYDVIIPQFEKENRAEHTIRLVGKDLDTYIEMCKNDLVMKELIRQMTMDRPFPTEEDKDIITIAIEQAIKQGKEKILTVPKGFYSGLKYDVDIDITGESVDTRVRAATFYALLQAITADPTILTDPVKRNFLTAYAEQGGVNLAEYVGSVPKTIADIEPIASKGSGGGMSAPSPMGMMGQQVATV